MKRDKRCKLLRDLISNLDIGMEIVDAKGKHPIHLNTCETLLRCFTSVPQNEWWRHLERLDNGDFRDHFEGRKTYYFAGSERERWSLVMTDVDCKRRGSLAGALGFCQHVAENLIPGMPSEPSTHGRGGHGYFIFDRGSLPPAAANEMLKALEKRLRGEMRGHDIENVEIKGLIPVIRFQARHDRVIQNVTVKEGTLAKLPRTLTYDQLKNMPVLTVAQLQELIKDVEEPSPRVMRIVPAGSIAGKYITPEMLDWLPKYEALADTLMEHHALPVSSGRGVATAKDIAILLLILEFFNDNPNPDGSMPYERIKGMWNALSQAGDIDRKWDDKRYAAARNYLSSLGLITWTDASYKMPVYQGNKKIDGRAARWGLSAQMLRLLEAVKCDSQTVEVVTLDNQERENTPLSVTRIDEFIISLEQKTPGETTKPHLEEEIVWSADEVTAKVSPFEEWAIAA